MTGPSRLPRQQPEIDLLAVQRDDRALSGVSLREHIPDPDVVLTLLQALTVDVDTGLARLLADPLPAAHPDQHRRRHGGRRQSARVLAAAIAATGLLSVSGVAAAVTGDALAPYRRVLSAVSGPDLAGANRAREGADTARVRQEVGALGGSLGSGHLAHAQLAIDRLHVRILDLPASKRPDALRRLSRLEAQLAMLAARQDARTAHARGLGVGLATAPGQVGESGTHGRSEREGDSSAKPATGDHGKSGEAREKRGGGSTTKRHSSSPKHDTSGSLSGSGPQGDPGGGSNGDSKGGSHGDSGNDSQGDSGSGPGSGSGSGSGSDTASHASAQH